MRRPLLFAVCIVALAAGALAVRLPRLALRPMHCDEANQAKKTAILAGIVSDEDVYRYDPRDHHGPSLYWLTLPSLWLSGAASFAETSAPDYRIVPVLFGVGLVLLLLLVSDGLGRGAALVAGVLTAVSPAMVFYSRYYIQETLLVFFTFAALACAWRYVRSGTIGWAAALGASLGMMHATKETWILAAAATGAGLIGTIAWMRWRDGALPRVSIRHTPCAVADGTRSVPDTFWRRAVMHVAIAALAACCVATAFYSSFGSDRRGPIDSVLAYGSYWRRGASGGGDLHTHPWHFYLQLLTWNHPAPRFFWTEGLIVGLAVVGAIYPLSLGKRAGVKAASAVSGTGVAARWHWLLVSQCRPHGQTSCPCHPTSPHPGPLPEGEGTDPRRPFCCFLAIYTAVLVILYAVIPYKTPWCLLSFLHGMILLAGVGACAILRRLRWRPLQSLAGLALAAGVAHLGWQCYQLNFNPRLRLYADQQRNPYVYAHASSDVLNLADAMERLAQVSPEGHDMAIHVVTPQNYWPLPWYLRQFHRAGYWQKTALWQTDTRRDPPPSVIILTAEAAEQVGAHLRAAYAQRMNYGLQPGVNLMVYVREDLWEAFSAAASPVDPAPAIR